MGKDDRRHKEDCLVHKPRVPQNASHKQTNNQSEEEEKVYRDNKQRTRGIRRKRKVGPRWHMILRYRYLH